MPRLRDLGLSTGVLPPGPLNAITDVAGVRVGFATLIRDEPSVVRTGITAIWPAGDDIWTDHVFAGAHCFNGNGEMTGLAWIAEQGLISAPLCITNTYSVGLVRDAICALAVRDNAPQPWHLPVAAETCDGWLSDSASFPVTVDLALAALDDQVRTNILIFDACRNNPFERKVGSAGPNRTIEARSGLAAPTSLGTGATLGAGMLIAFATAPGRVALDGEGANSPFSSALS